MDEIIKQVLKTIPQYVINFFKLISSPRQFPIEKLPKNPDEPKDSVTDALKFLLISYVLIVILNAWKSTTEITYKNLAVVAIATLIQMSLFVFAIYLAWKIFGSTKEFLNYFIIYSYHFGVIFIIIGLFGVISDGYLKVFDIDLYNNLHKVKTPADFNQGWLNKSTYLIALGIIILGYVLGAIWGWIGWGAYRLLNNFTRSKSFAVLFVAGPLSWIVLFISYIISNGLKK